MSNNTADPQISDDATRLLGHLLMHYRPAYTEPGKDAAITIRRDPDGLLDEVFGPAHLEQMDAGKWCLTFGEGLGAFILDIYGEVTER